jgi:cysteine desulfurase/selenocysteine lyase
VTVATAPALLDLKGDFPGLAGDWAYLDTAATSQ